MAADDKVVIGQTHGSDDPEAVLIGYLLGVEALRAGKAGRHVAHQGRHLHRDRGLFRRTLRARRRPSKTSTPSTWRKAAASSPVPCVSRPAILNRPRGCRAPKSKARRRSMSSHRAGR